MEKIAGRLEDGLADGKQHIVISDPGFRLDIYGVRHIRLSPRYARHLANVPKDHAVDRETQAADKYPSHYQRGG